MILRSRPLFYFNQGLLWATPIWSCLMRWTTLTSTTMFSTLKKKKSNKDKNFYPCGPGHVVILAQKGRMGNSKDVQAINGVFLKMGTCTLRVCCTFAHCQKYVLISVKRWPICKESFSKSIQGNLNTQEPLLKHLCRRSSNFILFI